jgi:nucleotide-binding universal stress UspA family protein
MSVLVCYDGSIDAQEAISRAATLANDGQATVLTVWEPFSAVLARTGAEVHFSGYEHLREIDSASEENAEARAADGVARARNAGLHAEPLVVAATETVAEAILAVADRLDADVIVMGARGLRGTRPPLLGGVARMTIQHATRPVVVVRRRIGGRVSDVDHAQCARGLDRRRAPVIRQIRGQARSELAVRYGCARPLGRRR